LHVCLSSGITQTNLDTSQIELGILLDDLGFLVGDWASKFDENSHELSDKVFCTSALTLRRTNELTDSSIGKPVVEAADRPGSERGTR